MDGFNWVTHCQVLLFSYLEGKVDMFCLRSKLGIARKYICDVHWDFRYITHCFPCYRWPLEVAYLIIILLSWHDECCSVAIFAMPKVIVMHLCQEGSFLFNAMTERWNIMVSMLKDNDSPLASYCCILLGNSFWKPWYIYICDRCLI